MGPRLEVPRGCSRVSCPARLPGAAVSEFLASDAGSAGPSLGTRGSGSERGGAGSSRLNQLPLEEVAPQPPDADVRPPGGAVCARPSIGSPHREWLLLPAAFPTPDP